MSITSPSAAVDGTTFSIFGVGMAGTPQLVATNGVKEIVINLNKNTQTATEININLDTGLASLIANPLTSFSGVPLTDSQWSLKWRVGVDELVVDIAPPANHQQREVDNAEKFGGILAGVDFGTQDQLVSPIVTSTNTVKQTKSNGKATGFFDGTQQEMLEAVTHYIFTEHDGLWRSRLEQVAPYDVENVLLPILLENENQSSPNLFGASSHTFNINAAADTDGTVILILVQRKNGGAATTTIEVDSGPVTGPSHIVRSNAGGIDNQLIMLEVKPFAAGAHTVEVENLDGINGVTIVARYYKNYTSLGNFSGASATSTQPQNLTLGDVSHSVTAGNRGLSAAFAGGVNNLVSVDPQTPYDQVDEWTTTDVGAGDPRFNGRFKTVADLEMVGVTTDASWNMAWDSANVPAECMTIFGELENVSVPVISYWDNSEAWNNDEPWTN